MIHYIPMCLRCNENLAESETESVFQLCECCAEAVFPGADQEQYAELLDLYAYC